MIIRVHSCSFVPFAAKLFLRFIFFVAITLSPTHAAPKSDDLKNLRSRIESLQKELASSEESKSEAADALRASERGISLANRRLAELAREQHAARDTLLQLQDKSQHLKDGIASQQSALGKLLYQRYLNGQQGYLRLLLNHRDPNQTARDIYYYGYLARAHAQGIARLRAGVKELEGLTRESQEKAAQLAAMQNEEAAQKKNLEREKTEHKKLLLRVSGQIKKQQNEIGKLKRDEARLAKLVEKIARLISPKKPVAPLSNERVPGASPGGAFASLKGKLGLPVRGELVGRFGSPREAAGMTWKGLFIRAAGGDAVKAVAAGQVVFADWLRGFGNILIVDHGDDYLSLYGNNETLYKQVGDTLQGGDTIAAVGNSGGNPDSGLYFELRHKGKPFDPLGWATLK